MAGTDEVSRKRDTLSGLRVLEIGHFVAAPFCTRLLADLGADVIKIEPLSGDPVRSWGEMIDGKSLWWSMHGRNKRSVALDLKKRRAREIVLDLVRHCDVMVENFRPGQMKKFGLGPEAMRRNNPDLIIAHISGFGQTGPIRDRAAFGLIGEAIGGLRYLTNHLPGTSDLPPVRVGVSIGDSISGIYAAMGILAALWQRDRKHGDGCGRTIDVALTESVLSLMEGMLPEFGALEKIKEPTGGGIATAAPSNAYPTRDGSWVLIGANSNPLFARLMGLIGRTDLIRAAKFVDNAKRVENSQELDRIIVDWTSSHSSSELLSQLEKADIPSCKVYTAADCAHDTQYLARGMVRKVYDPHFENDILQAGIVPHVSESPGSIRWTGPSIGQHTAEVLSELLDLSPLEISELRDEMAS